uniref:Uncharacterized protein n=1 Tax=Kalanchoe fedtschenkoi TaxID=63787 RepID=A0A7N0T8C2_KALFE
MEEFIKVGSRKIGRRRRRAVGLEHRKVEMRRKLRKLRRLIPGGQESRLQANSLFMLAADYIMLLRFKVALLQALTSQLDSKQDQP